MKPKPSDLQAYAEPHDAESADLDETVDLPFLLLPGNLKECNDDDAGPPAHAVQNRSADLIELGESINENLERIAAALENLHVARSRSKKKRKVAVKSKKTTAKPIKRKKTTRKS